MSGVDGVGAAGGLRLSRRFSLAGVALGLAVLVACGSDPGYVEPPPPTVTVATPSKQTVTDYLEVTGSVESIETVEIRARVEGFLQAVHFEEGATVQKGALLYEIDPKEYQAVAEQAEAALATAKASLTLAQATLQRRQRAFETGAVSELEVLENRAQRDVATARVQSAEAELRKANLDLGYTRIHAPVTGRIGDSEVDPGNLVGATEKTLLTTLVRYHPIYVYFTINERELLRFADAALAEVEKDEDRVRMVGGQKVEVARATDEGFPFEGVLDFADQGINSETGTMRLRAVFPNPDPVRLIPGFFVRGRLPLRVREGQLVVSERAFGSDQSGRYVLVVDDQDVAQYRPVKIGALIDGMRVIEDGISADDRVITNGVLYARPGAKVKPETESTSGSKAPANAQAAAD